LLTWDQLAWYRLRDPFCPLHRPTLPGTSRLVQRERPDPVGTLAFVHLRLFGLFQSGANRDYQASPR